jgi:hypothetical protein
MSAWDTPLVKRSAACIRVASMAAKSLRGRTRGGAVFVLAEPGGDVEVGMHQLFHSMERERGIRRTSLNVSHGAEESSGT